MILPRRIFKICPKINILWFSHVAILAQRAAASVSGEVINAQRRAAISISLRHSGHFWWSGREPPLRAASVREACSSAARRKNTPPPQSG
jgi:hypothetical protein